MFYLKDFDSEKFFYIDDETIELVDRTSFAESYESLKAANQVLKTIKNDFPHAEITDKYGCPV